MAPLLKTFDADLRRRWRRKTQLAAEIRPPSWPPAYFADNQDSYKLILASLFHGHPDETAGDLTHLIAPSFFLRTGGNRFDYDQFVNHVTNLRRRQLTVSINMMQFLRDGVKLAAHLISHVTKQDGSTVVRSETYHFAEVYRDGRIAWIIESVESGAERQARPRVPTRTSSLPLILPLASDTSSTSTASAEIDG